MRRALTTMWHEVAYGLHVLSSDVEYALVNIKASLGGRYLFILLQFENHRIVRHKRRMILFLSQLHYSCLNLARKFRLVLKGVVYIEPVTKLGLGVYLQC